MTTVAGILQFRPTLIVFVQNCIFIVEDDPPFLLRFLLTIGSTQGEEVQSVTRELNCVSGVVLVCPRKVTYN